MINPQWLELPISRTSFHGPKDVRAIEVRLYLLEYHLLWRPTVVCNSKQCSSDENITSGPSCSKLTMSLVNVSLKLLSLNMAYMLIFLLKKMWVAFAFAKATHIFQQNTCELDTVLTRAVKILTTNELVKLTTLWTTGPWYALKLISTVFCCEVNGQNSGKVWTLCSSLLIRQ